MRSCLIGASGCLGVGRRGGVGVLMAVAVVFFGGASSAWAGVGFSVSPKLGGPLKVGNTGIPSHLTITNASTVPEATLNVTLSTITLVPSCCTKAISGQDCPAASVDPGVLRVSATGSGQPGTACAGTTFTISVVDASESKYELSPAGGPVVLGAAAGGANTACTIDFTVDVLKAPTKDADPAPGLQTDQVGFAAGQATDGASGSNRGTSQVTISPGSSTTSVYWDGNGNLAADPNPFGGIMPSGLNNVALGQHALHHLTTNHDNLASGFQALSHNTTGNHSQASGTDALFSNTVGNYNVASGYFALGSNTSGSSNVATGVNALYHSTGSANTALGTNALLGNNAGSSNVAVGNGAGKNLRTGSNNIDVANAGLAADAGKIRIGTPGTQTAAFVAGVSGVTLSGATKTVVVSPTGQLGTAPAASGRANRPVDSGTDSALARDLRRQAAQLRRQAAQLRAQAAELRKLADFVHSRR